jgi:hypothetical protein
MLFNFHCSFLIYVLRNTRVDINEHLLSSTWLLLHIMKMFIMDSALTSEEQKNARTFNTIKRTSQKYVMSHDVF